MGKKIIRGKFSIGEILLAGYAVVFARPLFLPFNKLLFHLAIRGLGIFNYQSYRLSGENYLISKLLPKLLTKSKKPVMFDVGANEGKYTSDLLVAFPKASVYSFEPHGKTCERLAKRVGHQCQIFNFGLGESSGSMKLYDVGSNVEGTSHASLYSEVISDLHHKEVNAIEVEIKMLDDVVDELGLERIDFLKIDTEGNELAVLKGARRLLTENRIGVIHFEFNDMNLISGCFMRDFRLLLSSYKLYRLLPNGLAEISDVTVLNEIFGFQNIIAIPAGNSQF